MPDEAPGGTLWRAANANRPNGPSRAHWAQRKAGDVAIAVSGYVADTPLDSSNPVALPTRWATYWRPPSTAYGLQRRYNDVPTAVSGYVTDTPLDVSAAPGGTLHRALSAAIYRRGWNYPVQLRRVIDAAEPDALLNPAEPVPFATYRRSWTYPQQLRVLLDVSDPDALLNPSKLIPASTYRRGWVYPSQLRTSLDVSTAVDDPLTTPPLPVRQAA